MSPKRTCLATAFIVIIYFTLFSLNAFPIFCTELLYINWNLTCEKNRSFLAVIFTDNWNHFSSINRFCVSSFQLLSFVTLSFATAILVFKLNKRMKWQSSAIFRSDGKSKKGQKTGAMVSVMSIVFLLCYTPSTIGIILSFFMDVTDKFISFSWSVAFLFETANSSSHIFVYYKMSSKYRDTFHKIFFNKRKKHKK